LQDQVGVFLYDMRKGLPDSLLADNGNEVLHFKSVFPATKQGEYKGDHVSVSFSDRVFYDTLYLEVKEDYEEQTIQVNNAYTPLHSPLNFSFKPFAAPLDQEKTAIAQVMNNEGKVKYIGGKWSSDGSIKFKSKYFGKFKLVTDTKPPVIKKVVAKPDNIKFTITDNLSGIQSWRATLNGKWLLFCYEHKRHLIWAEPLEKGQPMEGDLWLEVKDNLGNIAVYEGKVK
jgi:hypothetical protein